MSIKKTLLSGVKPTGRPHIGNFFGAMRQFVEMQNEYAAMYMIADYHALNLIQNKAELSQNILDVALDYLAIGLDPQKSIVFKQSDVPEHAELCWIFDAIITGTSAVEKQLRVKATSGTVISQFDFAGPVDHKPDLVGDKDAYQMVSLNFMPTYNTALSNWLKAQTVNGLSSI